MWSSYLNDACSVRIVAELDETVDVKMEFWLLVTSWKNLPLQLRDQVNLKSAYRAAEQKLANVLEFRI